MRIQVEDYYGNDICSFVVNESQNNNGLQDISQFVDCSYADVEVDEYSEPYVRIQLDKKGFTLYSE